MNLGTLSYTITATTAPLNQKLGEAKQAIGTTDKSMKDAGKSISDSTKKMSGASGGDINALTGQLGSVSPAAGQAVQGFQKMSMAARAFQAALGPIGLIIMALGAAIAALTAYFKGSVDGQHKMANIMAYLGGVADTVKDLFIQLGRWIVWAFENPQEAVKQLWDIIKNNIINRFKGLVDMITSGWTVISKGAEGVGLAVAGIFNKEKREQAKKAFAEMREGMVDFAHAAIQAQTGVDDLIGKLGQLGEEAGGRAKENLALQQRENQLWQEQLDAKLDLAKIDGEIAEARRIANDDTESTVAQMQAMEKAQELVAEKYGIMVGLAEEELGIQRDRMALGEDSVADKEREVELAAALLALSKQEDDMKRSLIRRQTTINNRVEEERKQRMAIFEEMKQARMEEEDRAVYLLQQSLEKQLSAHSYNQQERADITAYYENQIQDIRQASAVEDKKLREQMLAEIDKAAMSEKERIEEALKEKLDAHQWTDQERSKITAFYEDQITQITKDEESKRAQEKEKVLERIRQAGLTEIQWIKEQMDKELEMEGLTGEEKYNITKYWEDRKLEYEKSANDQRIEDERRVQEAKSEMQMNTLHAFATAISVLSQMQMAAMNHELKMAGDNEAKKEAIHKKYAKKRKAISISEAIIGTAKAVINALQTVPFPLGVVMAGLAGAMGAAQIATIAAAPMKTGGVIPPGFPNDTYPALLTSGETVIPAPMALSTQQQGPLVARLQNAGPDLMVYIEEQGRRYK